MSLMKSYRLVIALRFKLLLVIATLFTGILNAQISLNRDSDSWTLLVDGEPFEVKGATFGYDEDVANYDKYFKELNYLGVNSIRTWGTGENTPQLLDAADKHGIKVMLGIWMRHGKPGMEADDSFDYLNDEEGKQEMYDDAIETVKKYKDHPAILTWGIGNEVYLNMETDEEKIAYSNLLEKICKKVKKIDKKHPITSVDAWTFGVDWWQEYVPSIDIYGINTYGGGANVIPEELAKKGVKKPYVITEFGVRGEWEINEDDNGVKPEPNDEEKYETIVRGYNEWIKPKTNCLGVYVFHYASDDTHIAPWLLTHFDGMTRPQYWAIREAYTGKSPVNYVPEINLLELPQARVDGETWVPIELEVSDKEGEELTLKFYYNQRTGSRKRRDLLTELKFRGTISEGIEILLPKESKGIKVYAIVSDAFGNAGIASTSIYLKGAVREYLVPSVSLPFYVYQDNENLPYVASAYMGNHQAMEVDLDHKENAQAGKTCIKITYNAESDWYGLGFVDPPNDWGDVLGGYDIRDAKSFSFWAKSSQDELEVNAGFGLIDRDKPYPDTGKRMEAIKLTNEWKKYTIYTHDLDLDCIRSGFVIFSTGQGQAHDIFLDDIVFE